jgi:NTE family protein
MMTKKLGIAFGGSGAEGIAGIAYIKALEEMNMKPDIVSGTGVGAVIAAMYAAGMTSQDMLDFLKEINFPGAKRPINLNKVKDAKYGILDGMGLEEYFQMVVPIKVFDRLYFPLKIVATEFETGHERVFSEGDVGAAVRAGVAVPGIFSPHEIDDVLYIDGSCVNPVPFDIIREDCDVIVCIDPHVDASVDGNDAAPNVFSALMSAYGATKKTLVREKHKAFKVDLFESVVIDDMTSFDFVRYEDIITFCEERAEAFKGKLKALIG